MASHVEGLGLSWQRTPLTDRLPHGLARLLKALKSRDELRASLPLVPGERLLSRTCDSSGRWVAASDRALYHHVGKPSGTAARPWFRVGWEEVGHVLWIAEESTL